MRVLWVPENSMFSEIIVAMERWGCKSCFLVDSIEYSGGGAL